MREVTFLVPPEAEGEKLKRFLRSSCQVSSGILTRLKWVYDGIQVNGEHSYVTRILHAGDVITLRLPRVDTQVEPLAVPLDILYEDDDLLVLDKPSGMPVHPSAGHSCDSVANAACFHAQQRGESFSFHPIYRLDKNTSGILVLAKHSYGASVLAFGVTKTYYAICEGILTGSGTVDAPIRRKEGSAILREVGDGAGSQTAVTHWKALRHTSDHTLLEIQLETGRTHQIRVHCAHIGHPLAGDDLYGGSREQISRQALHCGRVSFTHPVTAQLQVFTQDLPEDMARFFAAVQGCTEFQAD